MNTQSFGRTKRFWVRVQLQSLKLQSKEFLDIQATIECGFFLKRVRDMTRTYSYNLYIINSKLGWIISGRVLSTSGNEKENVTLVMTSASSSHSQPTFNL